MDSILYAVSGFFTAFFNSSFFDFIRFFLKIYVIVLFIDIVLMLALRGVGGNIIQGIYGADVPSYHRKRFTVRWEKIERQIRSGDETQYKLAILDADAIADEVLAMAKLEGQNMRERLENALPYQVDQKDRLLWAHGIRNDIIRRATYPVDRDLAEKTVEVFREFLKSWEVL